MCFRFFPLLEIVLTCVICVTCAFFASNAVTSWERERAAEVNQLVRLLAPALIARYAAVLDVTIIVCTHTVFVIEGEAARIKALQRVLARAGVLWQEECRVPTVPTDGRHSAACAVAAAEHSLPGTYVQVVAHLAFAAGTLSASSRAERGDQEKNASVFDALTLSNAAIEREYENVCHELGSPSGNADNAGVLQSLQRVRPIGSCVTASGWGVVCEDGGDLVRHTGAYDPVRKASSCRHVACTACASFRCTN